MTALSGEKQAMDTSGGSGMKFGVSRKIDSSSQPLINSSGRNSSQPVGKQKLALNTQKSPGDNWIFLFRADLQRAMDTPNKCRLMTLKETKDMTTQLFESKNAANLKAAKVGTTGLSFETMEIFVYRTMEKRYGLRSLAAEHTGALLTSVQRYANEDNGVLVFMKVFSNEIEEEFQGVQSELYRSIVDLIRVQLMSK